MDHKGSLPIKLSKEIMSEVWKQIPEAQPGYEASDQGNIRSPKKQLSPSDNGCGYQLVTIKWNDAARQNTCTVHSLVALTFNGPCPEGMEIGHRDHKKANNVPANLHYVTRAENMNGGHPRTAACWLPWDSTPVGGSFVTVNHVTGARYAAGRASSQYQKGFSVSRITKTKTLVTRVPMLDAMTCSATAEIGGAQ